MVASPDRMRFDGAVADGLRGVDRAPAMQPRGENPSAAQEFRRRLISRASGRGRMEI
jgi:hypothetical protein